MEAMRSLKKIIIQPLIWLLLFAILLSACSERVETPPEIVETPSPAEPTLTPSLEPPTATPLPAAAVVNGERIPLDWFQSEVDRYVLAQERQGNTDLDLPTVRELVLNDLIEQVLFAQAALAEGASFDDQDVQARIDQLAAEVDLEAWMAEWGYTQDDLFESLRLQMLVAYQRDLITGALPEAVEQVELQQVFAFTEAGANRALASLNSGTPFDDVAFEFSPNTGGYLGWAPRGYLLVPAVEEAVFDQPVGTYTEIIESELGYHIVLVIAREVRPLTSDARQALARQALHTWLTEVYTHSVIEVLVD